MIRFQGVSDSDENCCMPTGSVNISLRVVAIKGQMKAFQLPRKLNMQSAPIAGKLKGTATRQ